MKQFHLIIGLLILFPFVSFEQDEGSTSVKQDSTFNDTTKVNQNSDLDTNSIYNPFLLRKKPFLRQPTMPRYQISEKQNNFSIHMSNDYFRDPAEKTNWDALNMPTKYYDYEMKDEYLKPLIPITPLITPKNFYKPLSIHDYTIPTRKELDILRILWMKEDVMDTTIYSCLDTIMNITMEDLNQLLEKMTQKGMVSRKQVSPRNEFNAFGVLIEMSLKNIRNRVYEYQSNIDQQLMKRFIDANSYLFKEDSSLINQKQFEAVRKDSTLLKDLNTRISKPK